MATRQYIGARYVPIIVGEWDNTIEYEPLMIVTYNGNSYTSRTYIPVGIDINNTTYWACTGDYNAQVAAYRQEVLDLSGDVDSYKASVDSYETKFDNLKIVNVLDNGVVGDGVTDDTAAIQAVLTDCVTRYNVVFPKGDYLISDSLVIPANAMENIYNFNGSRIICSHNGDAIVYDGNNVELGFLEFNNLIIQGTNPAYGDMSDKISTGAGIKLITAYHNKFNNCYVFGFKYGVTIATGIGNNFNDCYFRFNEYGVNIVDEATNQNVFDNCSIRENWVNGVRIDGIGTANLPMHNIFSSCLIENNKPYVVGDVDTSNGIGVYMRRTTANIFTDNYFEAHRISVYVAGSCVNNLFKYNRYVNNTGGIVEFNGDSSANIKCNRFIGEHQGSTTSTSSIVINTTYSQLYTNVFSDCLGFVLDNIGSVFPSVYGMRIDSSNNGSPFSKGNVGLSVQNMYTQSIPSNLYTPYLENATLHCRGYGDIQITSLSSDISIEKVVDMQQGDILIINNYQTAHSITLVNGSVGGTPAATKLKLYNNTDVVLNASNQTIVLYKNYTGQIVELSRNF